MSLTTPLWKRSWPFLLLATSLVLGATYLKVFLRSRQEFQRAERLLKKGRINAAIRQYGRAVRWYTPGNRYTKAATQRLLKISNLSYQSGNWEKAIMALQHLRNALYSIRSVYQPYNSTLKHCLHKLANSLSNLPPHESQKISRPQFQQQLLKHLQDNPSPPVWQTLLAAASYLMWLFSLSILLWFWHRLSHISRVFISAGHLLCMFAWMWALLG